jgi:hypothetical protein
VPFPQVYRLVEQSAPKEERFDGSGQAMVFTDQVPHRAGQLLRCAAPPWLPHGLPIASVPRAALRGAAQAGLQPL